MLLGAGEPLLVDGTDLYSGPTSQDIQHVLPSVVLMAAVLFVARPAVSASWLVGAGIAVIALDYASTMLWVGLRVGYEDWEVGVESLVLRTAGAAFVLVAVFVAGRAMRQSRPPLDWPSGTALAAASVLTLVGAAGQHYHWPADMPSAARDRCGRGAHCGVPARGRLRRQLVAQRSLGCAGLDGGRRDRGRSVRTRADVAH